MTIFLSESAIFIAVNMVGSQACLRSIQKESFCKILDSVDKKVQERQTEAHSASNVSLLSACDVGPIVWKILLLDATTQKMIGPLMKANELYEHNVTLYL